MHSMKSRTLPKIEDDDDREDHRTNPMVLNGDGHEHKDSIMKTLKWKQAQVLALNTPVGVEVLVPDDDVDDDDAQ